MTETIKEFDRSKYSGQVHAWLTDEGKTLHGKPRISVWICRRYTNPESDDDALWTSWLRITGNDHVEIAIKMLHFCSCLSYEIVSLTEAHDTDPELVNIDILDTISDSYHRQSEDIYTKYKEQADKADIFVANIGEEVNNELSSLFAAFSDVQKLDLGPN